MQPLLLSIMQARHLLFDLKQETGRELSHPHQGFYRVSITGIRGLTPPPSLP